MTNDLTVQEKSYAAAQDWLEGHQQKIAALLGKSPQVQERFMASVMNALRQNDTLLQAAKNNKASFLNAILQAAQAGLDIGGVRKHGALVPYAGEVTFIAQYQGLIHLMTSSEDAACEDVDAEVIHENDHWEMWKDQDGTHFKFSPAKQNPGAVVGAYACAYLKGGRCKIRYMPIEEIHRHRERSVSFKKGKSSPWKTDYEAMVRKTPIRMIASQIPMTNQLEAALQADSMDEGVIDMSVEPKVVSEHRVSEQVQAVEIEEPKKSPRRRRSPRNQVTPKPAPKPAPEPEPEPEPPPPEDPDMPDIPTRKELIARYMSAMKSMDDVQRKIVLKSAAEACDGDFNPATCDLEVLKIVTEDAEDIIQ